MSLKNKLKQNLLNTASLLAISSAFLSSSAHSMPMPRYTDTNAGTDVRLTSGDGTASGMLFTSGSTLEMRAPKNVLVDGTYNILAVDVQNQDFVAADKYFQISQNSTIGSIVDRGANASAVLSPAVAKAQIKFTAGKTLTLSGSGSAGVGFSKNSGVHAPANNYSALANVDFNDQAATLVVDGNITLNSDIDNKGVIDHKGILKFDGTGVVTGNIGATRALEYIKTNTVGTVDLGAADKVIKAKTLELSGNTGNNVNVHGAFTGNANFKNTSTLNLRKSMTGNIDFLNQQGSVRFADGVTLTGSIENTDGAGGTAQYQRGILNFEGSASVSGDIGTIGRIQELVLNGAGEIKLQKVKAGNISIKHNDAKLILNGASETSGIKFFNPGKLVIGGNLTGDVNFYGQDATTNIRDGVTVAGSIDNNSATDYKGTLQFDGSANVTGNIGATKSLAYIKTSAIGTVDLGAGDKVIKAKVLEIGGDTNNNINMHGAFTGDVKFNNTGTLYLRKSMAGNIDFLNRQGTVRLGDGVNLTGAVDNTDGNGGAAGSRHGILAFDGSSNISDDIGMIKRLEAINLNGAGDVNLQKVVSNTINIKNDTAKVTLNGVSNVNSIAFFNPATAIINADLTGSINFNGQDALTNLANGVTVAGDIDNNSATDYKGILKFDGGANVTGDIGATKAIAIADLSGAGDVVLKSIKANSINIKHDDARLILNGVSNANEIKFFNPAETLINDTLNGNIDFNGQAALAKIADGVTVNGNVDNTVIADYKGTLQFDGSATVTGDIGSTKSLEYIKTSAIGTVDLGETDKVIKAKLLEINGDTNNNVNMHGAFTGDAKFNNTGTLYLHNNMHGNVDFFNKQGSVRFADGVTLDGNINNTDGNGGPAQYQRGILTFDGGAKIAGDVGTLKRIEGMNLKGAGDVSLQNVKSGSINIQHDDAKLTLNGTTDTNGIKFFNGGEALIKGTFTGDIDFYGQDALTKIADGVTINGNINNTGADSKGTLHFEGNNTYTGDIGATKALEYIKTSAIGNVELGAADKTIKAKTLELNGNTHNTVTMHGTFVGDAIFNSTGTLNLRKNMTGDIDFFNKQGSVRFADGVTLAGNINNTDGNGGAAQYQRGILNFDGGATVTGNIGELKRIEGISLQGAGDVSLQKVNAGNISIKHDDARLLLNGPTDTNGIKFFNTGSVVLNDDMIGDIDFFNNQGSVRFADGVILDGDIDNTDGTGAAAQYQRGILAFEGSATVTGDIGELKRIESISLQGAGDVSLKNVRAGSISIKHDAAKLTLDGVTDTNGIKFFNPGEALINGALTGDIDFYGQDALAKIADGVTINGNINNTGADDDKGTLQINGNATITGDIGATKALEYIKTSAIGNVDLGAADKTIKAKTLELNGNTNNTVTMHGAFVGDAIFNSTGTLNLRKNMTGDIDFFNKQGSVRFADGVTLAGNINNTDGNSGPAQYQRGLLTFEGSATVTGNIGELKRIEGISLQGAGDVSLKNVRAGSISIKHDDAKLSLNGPTDTNGIKFFNTGSVVLNDDMIGDIDFFNKQGSVRFADGVILDGDIDNTDGTGGAAQYQRGILAFDGGATVTGDIGELKRIESISLQGPGDVSLKNVRAGSISIKHDAAKLTLDGITNTNGIKFFNSGEALVNGALTGDIDFYGQNALAKIADSVIITGNINNTAEANRGVLEIAGNATILGDIGTANSIKAVNINSTNTDAMLTFGGNVKAEAIDAASPGSQILNFASPKDVEIKGIIGSIHPFKQLKFSSNKKVTIVDGLKARENSTFNIADNAYITINDYDLADTDIITQATNATIVLNHDQNIDGNIARFGTMLIDGDRVVNINNHDFKAKLATKVTNNGIINVNVPISLDKVGQENIRFKTVNILDNTIVNSMYADEINLKSGLTANDNIGANRINLADVNANFTSANAVVKAPILPTANKLGIVSMFGGQLQNNIGSNSLRLKQVNILSEPLSIAGDIYAQEVNVASGVKLQKPTKIVGTTTIDNATIDLFQQGLTLTGDTTIINNTTINTEYNESAAGHIIVGSASKLTSLENMVVSVDDRVSLPKDGARIHFMRNSNGTLLVDLTKMSVNSKNAFSNWTQELSTDGIYLRNSLAVASTLKKDAASSGTTISDQDAATFEELAAEGSPVVAETGSLPTSEARTEAANRALNTTTSEVDTTVTDNAVQVSSQIGGRVSTTRGVTVIAPTSSGSSTGTSPAGSGTSTSGSDQAPSELETILSSENNYISGVAAGNEVDRFGIWISPIYSRAHKKQNQNAGYKSNAIGGTIGFDTKVSDTVTLGVALSSTVTKVKHKDLKAGDSTKIKTHLFSVYGSWDITPNYFLQAMANVGTNTIRNYENRIVPNVDKAYAQANYKANIASGEINAGANHYIKNKVVLTPTIGLNYSVNKAVKYKETGTAANQLLNVNRRSNDRLEAILGLKIASLPIMVDGMSISAEAHASFRHSMLNSGNKVTSNFIGSEVVSTKKYQPRKNLTTLGAGVTLQRGACEYSLSSDVNLAKKYRAVTGTLNLRVNF